MTLCRWWLRQHSRFQRKLSRSPLACALFCFPRVWVGGFCTQLEGGPVVEQAYPRVVHTPGWSHPPLGRVRPREKGFRLGSLDAPMTSTRIFSPGFLSLSLTLLLCHAALPRRKTNWSNANGELLWAHPPEHPFQFAIICHHVGRGNAARFFSGRFSGVCVKHFRGRQGRQKKQVVLKFSSVSCSSPSH